MGYTQGVGISYEVDFDTFKELINKIFKKDIIEKASEPDQIDQDSSPIPEKKDSSKSNNTNSKDLHPNVEGRVPEED